MIARIERALSERVMHALIELALIVLEMTALNVLVRLALIWVFELI